MSVVVLEVECGAGLKGSSDQVPAQAKGYTYSLESGIRHRTETEGRQTGWIGVSGTVSFVVSGLDPQARYELELEAESFGLLAGITQELYVGEVRMLSKWNGRRCRVALDPGAYSDGELHVRLEPQQVAASVQSWKLIWKGGGVRPVVVQPRPVPPQPLALGLDDAHSPMTKGGVRLKDFRDTVAIALRDGKEYQVLIAELENPGPERRVVASVTSCRSRFSLSLQLKPGVSFHEVHVPLSLEPQDVTLELIIGEQVVDSGTTLANPPERYEIHFAPGTHMDFGWVIPAPRANALYRQYVGAAIQMMQVNPSYTWTAESVSVIKDYLQAHPNVAETIKAYLKEGRLEITANWVIPTTMTFDGEAILRQVAYPVAWLDRNLGYRPTVCHFYDVGDHACQMPQFLAKSGVRGYVWSLGEPDLQTCRWLASDGSGVIALKAPYSLGFRLFQGVLGEKAYGHRDVSMVRNVSDWIESETQSESGLIGESPHFAYVPLERDAAPPRRVDLEIVAEWNRRFSSPKIVFSTPSRYLNSLSEKVCGGMPTFGGQVSPPPPQWRGHLDFTQRAEGQIKVLHELLNAERFASLARILRGIPAPSHEIEEAWEGLLYSQDHNYAMSPVAPKGAEDEDVRYKESLISRAHFISREVIRAALGEIARAIHHQNPGRPIVVFNPLSWEREEVVSVPLADTHGQGFTITDSSGKPVRCQTSLPGRVLHFKAMVPASGYNTYYLAEQPALTRGESGLEPGRATSTSGQVADGPLQIENEFYRLEIDQATGFVKCILDKELDRELLSDCGPMMLEIGLQHPDQPAALRDEEAPHFERADSSVEDVAAEMGPVMERAVIRGRTVTGDGVIRWSRTLSLYAGIKKIAIESSFDWDEGTSALILEAFPFRVQQPRFTYEVPYGVMPSGNELSDLTPVQKWVALYDAASGTGVAVASDWMRWRASGSSLFAVTQAWGGSHYSVWEGEGPSNVRHYTITSYRGDWQENRIHRMGWENATSLVPVYQSSGAERSARKLPETVSFLNLDAPNVIISVVKPSWNGEDTVLRLYEAQGKPTRVALRLFPGPDQVLETDMTEDISTAKEVNVDAIDMKPFEVKTLLLQYGQENSAGPAGR